MIVIRVCRVAMYLGIQRIDLDHIFSNQFTCIFTLQYFTCYLRLPGYQIQKLLQYNITILGYNVFNNSFNL